MEAYKKVELACGAAIAAEYNANYHGSPLQRRWDRKFMRLIRREVPTGARVLDLASGPGALWGSLADGGYRVVGLDLSLHMLIEGRRARSAVSVVNADVESLPFPDESFDAIICSSALHHLADAEPAVREVGRVLKPYGVLVGREPNDEQAFGRPGWMSHAVMSLVNLVQRRHGMSDPDEPELHEHHRSLAMTEFVSMLSRHLTVHRFTTEFPFSSLFARVPSEYQARLIAVGDRLLADRKGSQVYYAARKHGYTSGDVTYGIRKYLETLEQRADRPYSKAFLLFLLVLTFLLDLTLPKR